MHNKIKKNGLLSVATHAFRLSEKWPEPSRINSTNVVNFARRLSILCNKGFAKFEPHSSYFLINNDRLKFGYLPLYSSL